MSFANIFKAAQEGTFGDVRRFIEEGISSVNEKDNNGFTPLHCAQYNKNVEVIKYLIDQGADINAKSKATETFPDVTPLHIAVLIGNMEYAKILIDAAAKEAVKKYVNAESNTAGTPLHISIFGDNIKFAEFLIKAGANINADNRNGTPIIVAIINNKLEFVKILIPNKEVYNKSNFNYNGKSYTPLDFAKQIGDTAIIQYLANFKGEFIMSENFTDPRDGKVYKTVKIGNQIWMVENLAYDASSSKCYDNNLANCNKYGKLYDWNTAMKACPSGWHLPSQEEWQRLVDFAGGNEIAGKKLKAKNGWNNNGNGTDEYGFSALPGGIGFSGGDFAVVGNLGRWWSATEIDVSSAFSRDMSNRSEGVGSNDLDKTFLYSVRCVQDSP